MNEIVAEFLVETTENLDQLDADLVALEADPTSPSLLQSVFRTFHTVKGTSGFLGFSRLESLSHAAEGLLSELREGRLLLTPSRTDILLEVVDAVRALLAAIEATGAEDDHDLAALVARIEDARRAGDDDAVDLTADETSQLGLEAPAGPGPGAAGPSATSDKEAALSPAAAALRRKIPPPPPWAARTTPAGATAGGPAPVATVATSPAEAPAPAGPEPAPKPVAPNATTSEATKDAPGGTQGAAVPGAAERSVRVDVDLLDRIMREVGELVLARNQITAHARLGDDPALHTTVQRLSMIVSELQEEVMKTRMQPVEQLFAKLPRVVRDLAGQCSKKVRLELEGGDTELDRSLLEAVKDPLTHIVRNAVDHGLETPETRRAAGKDETGTLTVRAFHESGQVVLEIIDDGAGIDPARVREKALARGLLGAAELAAMGEREVVDLVFRPGFSTSDTVTNVSGRGVGMDVVRTNVERIGGTVELQSTPGAGTTLRVRIPLTLAIVPALLVGCHGQRYAIPQSHLLELVQVRDGDAEARLERVEHAVVYRLRDTLLPLVRLDDVLGLAPSTQATDEDGGDLLVPDTTTIVVVQANGLLLGVTVDEVIGTEEIVVKPLGQHVKHVPVFAGATILGDGGVALILDIPGVAAAARAHEGARDAAERAGEERVEDAAGERHSFVLLRVGDRRRVAVPLAAVSRLEEAAPGAIEHAAGRPVLQYRGELLPLVPLAEVLGEPNEAPEDPGGAAGGRPVIVCADGERHLGLLASEILDIVEGTFAIRPVAAQAAVVGSTIVDGRATDVLDVAAALAYSKETTHVA